MKLSPGIVIVIFHQPKICSKQKFPQIRLEDEFLKKHKKFIYSGNSPYPNFEIFTTGYLRNSKSKQNFEFISQIFVQFWVCRPGLIVD